ncbi:hypothetical protein HZC30_03660 [Candidatus Woesearchaeota archaeon]|nr:hypothetical protein [Candidatus Woesearchaeota archaeon]
MTSKNVRLVKPAWKETLKFLAGMLDEDKAKGLIELITEDYFSTKDEYDPRKYNPHLDDLCLAAKCALENENLNYDENSTLQMVFEEGCDKSIELFREGVSLRSAGDILGFTLNSNRKTLEEKFGILDLFHEIHPFFEGLQLNTSAAESIVEFTHRFKPANLEIIEEVSDRVKRTEQTLAFLREELSKGEIYGVAPFFLRFPDLVPAGYLIDLLKDSPKLGDSEREEELEYIIIHALVKKGHTAVMPLIEFLGSSHSKRYYAAQCLGMIGDERAKQPLNEILKATSENSNQNIPYKDFTVPDTIRCLSAPSPLIICAAEALKKWTMEEKLRTTPEKYSSEAELAIATEKATKGEEKAIDFLVNCLSSDNYLIAEKDEIITHLRRIKSSRAALSLVELIQSGCHSLKGAEKHYHLDEMSPVVVFLISTSPFFSKYVTETSLNTPISSAEAVTLLNILPKTCPCSISPLVSPIVPYEDDGFAEYFEEMEQNCLKSWPLYEVTFLCTAYTLGKRGGEEVKKGLLEFLKSKCHFRHLGVYALGLIGDEECKDFLFDYYHSQNFYSEHAFYALRTVKSIENDARYFPLVQEVLQKKLLEKDNRTIVGDVLPELVKVGKRTLPLLKKLLQSDNFRDKYAQVYGTIEKICEMNKPQTY